MLGKKQTFETRFNHTSIANGFAVCNYIPLEFTPRPDHPSSPLFYASIHPFIRPTPLPIGHLDPLPPRQPQNTVLNSPAYNHHPHIPPSSPSNLINLVLHPFRSILSSPPDHFILHSLQTEDVQYLKWNRMNIKWVAFGPGSLYSCLFSSLSVSLSLCLYHLWLCLNHASPAPW